MASLFNVNLISSVGISSGVSDFFHDSLTTIRVKAIKKYFNPFNTFNVFIIISFFYPFYYQLIHKERNIVTPKQCIIRKCVVSICKCDQIACFVSAFITGFHRNIKNPYYGNSEKQIIY